MYRHANIPLPVQIVQQIDDYNSTDKNRFGFRSRPELVNYLLRNFFEAEKKVYAESHKIQ